MYRKMIVALYAVCLLWSAVFADGGFVLPPPPTPEDIAKGIKAAYLDEPEQQAIIVFDGVRETLQLQARYEGTVADFAWIVPVPSRPFVDKGRKGLMEEIAEYFYQFRLEEWKAGRLKGGGMIALGEDDDSGEKKASKPQKVEVIEARRVGIFDLTVLRASEPNALANWLKKHKFQLPDTQEAKDILDHYIKRQMYFCALRVNRGSRRISKRVSKGWIHPITISFATDRPFYPLRITALHTRKRAQTKVLIHLFSRPDSLSLRGEKRLAHRSFSLYEHRFEPKDLPKCCKAFGDLGKQNYILTTVEGAVGLKGMYGDLWFATHKEELEEPGGAALWGEVLDSEADNNVEIVHNKCRLILADYPCTAWAAKAHERIQKMGKKAKELAGRDAQKRTIAAQILQPRDRYAEAVEQFRRISRMYPSRAAEAAENVQSTLAAEKAYLGELWSRIDGQREKGIKTKYFQDYYKGLVELMLVCRNLHNDKNVYSKALKKRFYAAGLAEVQWVDQQYAALMDKKFHITWKEVEWQAKRGPALAYSMCKKIIAVHPDTRYSKKATEFLQEMLK